MITFAEKFSGDFKTEALSILDAVLPDKYSFYINEFTIIKKSDIVGETLFDLNCRVNVESKDKIKELLGEFSIKSGTTYNQVRGDELGEGIKMIMRGDRKCHHHVRRHNLKKDAPHRSGSGRQPGAECQPGKNTDCLATINFILAGDRLYNSKRYKLSNAKQLRIKFPLEFKVKYIHNHSINSAIALGYRNVSKECEETFTCLFAEGHSPSSAFAQYKKDFLLKNEKSYLTLCADRNVMPDYMWAFHFHDKYMQETYGSVNGPDAYKLAEERVKAYNEKNGSELAKIERTEAGEIVVVVCDDLIVEKRFFEWAKLAIFTLVK